MGNIDGFNQALEALQSLDEDSRTRVLRDIGKKNPQMAARLKESLFSFSDLQFLLPSDFKIIWWEAPRKSWHLALRKAPAGVLKMIESHSSKRAFAELKEDLEGQGLQPLSKIIRAQKEICNLIRDLVGQGKMATPSARRHDPMV